MSDIPELRAERVGTQLRVWCQHCMKYRFHGLGNGHRAAHCDKPDSPYEKTGYYLREA